MEERYAKAVLDELQRIGDLLETLVDLKAPELREAGLKLLLQKKKDPAAVALGRKGGKKRAENLSAEELSEQARKVGDLFNAGRAVLGAGGCSGPLSEIGKSK